MKAVNRHSSKEQRLKNGLYLRSQFNAQLQQGTVPMHPRFEWLRRQARLMLELLLTVAKDYEKTDPPPADRASLADLLDIANMTQGHISGIINQGLLDPDDVKLLPYEQVTPALSTDLQAAIQGGASDDEDEDDEG